MRFKYKAKKGGEIFEAEAEAKNRFELYRSLQAQGVKLLSVRRLEFRPWHFEYWNERLASVPAREIILFAENLSTMLSAGLSLSRALLVAQKQTRNPKLKKAISGITRSVQEGDEFYIALSKRKDIFSEIFISMVRSGEIAGNLPDALKFTARQLDRIYQLKKKVKGAMIYPSVIVFAVFAVGVFMMTTVVPSLAKTFKDMNVELPTSTKVIIAISDFLSQNYILASFFTLVAVTSSVIFFRTRKGRWTKSWAFLHIPVIKTLSKEINSAYASRTIASLLKSGVDVVEATSIASDVVQNTYFKESLKKSSEDLQKGKTLSEALKKYEDLYPVMFLELISVGEETGSVSDMLQKVADYYEEEVNEKTKNMSTIIEPFLMLFIGVAVGFFAVAMMTPMYSITQAI